MYPHSISCEDMRAVTLRVKEALTRLSTADFRVKAMGDTRAEAEQLFRAMNDWSTATFSVYVAMKRKDKEGKLHVFNMTAYMEGVDRDPITKENNYGCQSEWMQIKVFDPYFFVSKDKQLNQVLDEPMLRQTFRFNYTHLTDSDIERVAQFLVDAHNQLSEFPFPTPTSTKVQE